MTDSHGKNYNANPSQGVYQGVYEANFGYSKDLIRIWLIVLLGPFIGVFLGVIFGGTFGSGTETVLNAETGKTWILHTNHAGVFFITSIFILYVSQIFFFHYDYRELKKSCVSINWKPTWYKFFLYPFLYPSRRNKCEGCFGCLHAWLLLQTICFLFILVVSLGMCLD